MTVPVCAGVLLRAQVPLAQMPRQRGIGMRRPKKKKVELIDEEPEEPFEADGNEQAAVDPAPSTGNTEEAVESAMVPEPPGKARREQALIEHEAAGELFVEAELNYAKQLAACNRIGRLNAERLARFECGVKRAKPSRAWRWIEKWYKWQLEQCEALKALGNARAEVAEASELALTALANMKTLEIERLRRELRRYKRRDR